MRLLRRYATIAQRGGQPVHRQQDAALHEFVVVAGAVAPQQLDLQMVQRLQIRETVEHRTCQRRVVGEQVVLTGDELVHADRAPVLVDDLVEHPAPQRLVVHQLGVARGQAHIGFGQHLRHVRQHGPEERPPLIEVLQHFDAAVALGDPPLDRRSRCRTSPAASPATGSRPAPTGWPAGRRSTVVGLRDVGRLPMFSAPISLTGVDALKYSTKPGVSWTNSA